MRVAAVAVLALLAAGCAPAYPLEAPRAPAQSPTQTQTQAQGLVEPLTPAPPPAPPLRSPIPQAQPQPGARDACGAAEMQSFVGRLRTEIPVPVDPRRQRVACTTCPMTEDADPTRLNFLFDAQTGRIRQIRCG